MLPVLFDPMTVDADAQTRYFPYSRQSKKKSHRGAITARMLANLLSIAGVDHVITMDLHVRMIPMRFIFVDIPGMMNISCARY